MKTRQNGDNSSVQRSGFGVRLSGGTGRAVFLSYAAQDAESARQISEALRAAGVEVWFDQSELRGGDAWDVKIRQQIKECALFVPVISRHTQQRLEGYFRLEWHLAERRMHHMHEEAAFLLPVAIDETGAENPRVPARFLDVQWCRVPRGQPAADFARGVAALLGNAREDSAEPILSAPVGGAGSSINRANAQRLTFNSQRPMNEPTPPARDLSVKRSALSVQRSGAPSAGRILIIEDDPTMQRVLKDNFEFSGYEVHAVADGAAAIEAVFGLRPDVILLDIMLPRINGFDVCRRIRKEGLSMPIIMLTAKSQESDIVLGLNLGADDYVAKPFSMEVLLARVQTCLRRRRPAEPNARADEFEFGKCKLNTGSHRLFRGGTELELTPKEFKLLEFFVQNVGRALTRQKILDGVWGEDLIVTERSVDRCVTTLRTKVEPDPDRPQFIRTIRDVGYRFETT